MEAKRRAALVVAVVAVVGLVVSMSAAWSSLGPEPSVREAGRGARPAFIAGAQLSPPTVVPPARPPSRSRSTDAVQRTSASLDDTSAGSRVRRPVRVTLGSIDVDARVRPVGVSDDGQMQLPKDPAVLGWYKHGSSLDESSSGSAVLAGHLDSNRFGLGPLVRLREMRVGDTVRVTLSDGVRTTYRVVRITRYDRQGLPDQLFSRSGSQRLRLITCGGEYDADAGGYQKNLVITAVPV